jgi:hypothetical protein
MGSFLNVRRHKRVSRLYQVPLVYSRYLVKLLVAAVQQDAYCAGTALAEHGLQEYRLVGVTDC